MESRTKTIIAVIVLVIAAVFCIFKDLSWVSANVSYSFQEVWDALTGNGSWASERIVRDQNAPRVVAGILVGAGLAITGSAMQAVFRNPLASPYILGLSSGASLGAAAGIIFTIPFIP